MKAPRPANFAAFRHIYWKAFLIQNTQNRESKPLQLKLDKLLRSMKEACCARGSLHSPVLSVFKKIKTPCNGWLKMKEANQEVFVDTADTTRFHCG